MITAKTAMIESRFGLLQPSIATVNKTKTQQSTRNESCRILWVAVPTKLIDVDILSTYFIDEETSSAGHPQTHDNCIDQLEKYKMY